MWNEQKAKMENAYHYTDSGLDNIWLVSGFECRETPYGPATSIHEIDDLHRAIGESIVRSGNMTGPEFRFLRVELDLSQRALAALLKAREQQIHRWENGKAEIPGTAQIAIAAYYLESLDPDSRVKELMDRLAAVDADLTAMQMRVFGQESGEWVQQDAA